MSSSLTMPFLFYMSSLMKKILFALFACFIAGGLSAQSVQLFFNNQDTLYVDPGSTFTIHLRVKDFTAVGTLQLTLHWEEIRISLVDHQSADLSDLFVNTSPGQLLAVWTDVGGLGETIADGSTILNLTFTAANNWPDTTLVTFGSTPLALELNQFDGNVLVPVNEIATPCVIIIRQCQTSVLLSKDSICHTEPMLILTPVCQQCLSLIWNDTLPGPSFTVAEDGWVRVEAKGLWDCAAKDSVFIAPLPTLSFDLKDYHGFPVSCHYNSDARIMALCDATQFLWSTGSQQATLENLPVGTYTVTVTNSYGCTSAMDTLLSAPPPLAVYLTTQSPVCFNEPDGYIQIAASGGIAPYTLNGNLLPAPSFTLDHLFANDYPLQISDENGCILDTIIVLDSPPHYQPMAILIQRPCYNETNGVIQLMGLPPGLTNLALNSYYIPYQVLISHVGAGTNQFTAVDSLGCTYEWAIQVTAIPRQLVNIGPDREVVKGTPLEIEANAVGGIQIPELDLHWSANVSAILSCNNCPAIHFTPIKDTQVILSAETMEGCRGYDTLLVSVSHHNLYFPNVFAPNASGENAFFLISAASTQQLDISVLEIFDRWGNLVFSKRDFSPNDQSAAWDGTSMGGDCPAGVYVWRAKTKSAAQFSGDVTLLR